MAALPVAIPLLMAAILMAAATVLPRRLADSAATATAAAVAALCGILMLQAASSPIVYWFGGWTPRDGVAIGIAFAIDPFGAGLALLVAVLATASFVFAWRYFDTVGVLFHSLMLVFLGAMAGFCLSGDLFTMFVFFELMGATAYALTGYKSEASALEGALNFAVSNSLAAFLVLWGLGLLYGRTGALNLAQLGAALDAGGIDGLVVMSFVLILCGFLTKAASVPFHFWLPDAHAVAPTPVCVLFSGVMVELGVYGVVRVYWTVFEGAWSAHHEALRDVLLGLGTLSALLGGVMCFLQRHLKRLLAFSTISHTGMVLMAVALLEPRALAGGALYLVGHGLIKASLFIGVGVLLHCRSSVDELDLRGKGQALIFTGLLFGLGGLGLAGLPPFGTHLGKGVIEAAAHESGQAWVGIVFWIGSALTGGAVLRAAGRVFLGWGPSPGEEAAAPSETEEEETEEELGRAPWVMVAPAAVLIGLALALGLVPGLTVRAERAARQFQDHAGYVAAVLEGRHTGEARRAAAASIRPKPWAGIGSAATAVGLAFAALSLARIPKGIRRWARRISGPIHRTLEALHSGHVGDYVTWIVIGIAVVGGLLAALVQ
jgi:multicomponent Na+:H+ antiporter subunit D